MSGASSTAGQRAFDLGARPALGREEFMTADCNRAAIAWIDRWPDWPAPALTIHGPAGCGKTHMAEVWRAKSGAALLRAAALPAQPARDLLGDAQSCVLDDAAPPIAERALFHLYNAIAERGGHLLITAREPPSRWPIALADLASRLRAAPTVAVSQPDDGLLGAVLVKLFADRQLRVGAQVIDYLLRHMDRSFEAARAIVAALDHAALVGHRPVTVPLAREILGQSGA